MSDALDIVIAGAGGMGSLFGSILQDGGHNVVLYDVDAEHIGAISAKGLKIEGFGGNRVMQMQATTDPRQIDRADVILFQCKAHGTRSAAQRLKPLVEGGAICVSFQNGLGNEQIIAEEVGAENVLGGLTAMAAVKLAPGVIRDFSRVPSYIGEMQGRSSARVEKLATAFSNAGLETHDSAAIQDDIWKKLIGNISLSALSGLTNKTAAACMRTPFLKTIARQAATEALEVAAAEGISLDRDAVIAGIEMISEPGGTGDNKSSLCEDLNHQRPTEVEVIYGSAIAAGKAKGLSTPTLDTLYGLVRARQAEYLESEAD